MKKRNLLRCLSVAICVAMLPGNGSTLLTVSASDRQAETVQETGSADSEVLGEAAEDQILIITKEEVSDKEAEKIADAADAACVETTNIDGEGTVAVLEIDASDTVEEAIAKAEENPDVVYAQPNYRYETQQTDDPYSGSAALDQWYLSRIKAEEAWALIDEQRSICEIEPVRTAILDTGADVSHEDLQTALNKELSVVTDGIDSFLTLEKDPDGHGTHVSGIIAGTAGNGKGIAGVASGGTAEKNLVDLIVMGVSDPEEPDVFYTYTLVSGIQYALEQNVKVMNMSLGGLGKDWILQKALANAYDEGMICVCAAGNEGTDYYVSPSDYGETVSVMNLTQSNTVHDTSNYGTAKDLTAPGTVILSTLPGDKYEYESGTSMAAPMVTAVAAMVYAVNPDLTSEQVRNILCATAEDIGAEGFDVDSGYGVIQADKAVEAAIDASDEIQAESIAFKEDTFTVNPEETVKLQTLVLPATALGTITWESSNSDIAEVDENGRVTGKAAGTTVITAAVDGQTASVTVTVNSKPMPESVEFFGNQINKMSVGATVELSARVLPADACEKSISWTSSDPRIATVDELGYVRARSVGTVTITAESYNHKSVSCEITVGPAVKSISFGSSTTQMYIGEPFQFQAVVEPEEAQEYAGIWYGTTNKTVIDIDAETGIATAKRPGQATITAYAGNGRRCYVRVTAYYTDYSGSDYKLSGTSAAYNKIRLKWTAIPNAAGYVIERSTKSSSGYKAIKTVNGSTTSYTDTNRTTGTKYYYRIRAYYNDNGKQYCSYSSKISATAKLTQPTVKAAAGKRKVTLSWSKISGASGYVIYRSTSKNSGYKRIAVVKGASKTKYIHSNLRSGQKYYYKIKAYRKVSSKTTVYSTASAYVGKTVK